MQIAPDAVTDSELADNAVDTAAIQDLAVVNAKVALATLTGDRLVPDTLTAREIAPDAITAFELADDAVDTAAIQDLAVVDAKIAPGVDGAKLTDGTVIDAKIADLDGAKLFADSVTAAQIAPDAITASELADNAVDTAAIQDAAVTDIKLAAGIDGAKLTDDTVTASKIPSSSLDRGLDKTSGSIGHTNAVIGETMSGITFDSQGHVTAAAPLVDTDLPPATITAIGGVSVPADSGLTVTGAGVLDHENNVAAGSISGIDYDDHGHISSTRALIGTDLPVATALNVGAVSVPGPVLRIAGAGELTHGDTTVAPGSYPKVTVDQQGHVTQGLSLNAVDIPELDASILTSGTFDPSLILDKSIQREKLADYAISYIQEAEPEVTDVHHIGCLWYQESTAQLRMYNGNSWMPVGFGRLSADNLRFGGTIDASTGLVTNITDDAVTAGIEVGDVLPTATDTLGGIYFVADTAGSNINVFDVVGVSFDASDWVLCISASAGWTRIDVAGSGGGAVVLPDLLDVTITTPQEGDRLTYNGSTSQWVNRPDGGVKKAGDTMTGDLFMNDGTSDVITLDASTGDIQSTSQNGGALAGFRNLMINGDFRIWQRGESGNAVALDFYTADRWLSRNVNAVGSAYTWAKFTTSNVTGIELDFTGATSYAYIVQKIEPANIRQYQGQRLTVSLYTDVPAPHVTVVGTIGGVPTILIDRLTMTSLGGLRWSSTFDLGSNVIGDTPGDSLGLFFYPNNGADAQPDGTVRFWNVQLEPGPVATPFEHRPIGTELALCQRYFQNVQLGSSNQAEFAMVTSGGSSTNCTPHILYLSPMRDVGGAGNLTVDRTNMTAATGANSFTGAGTSRSPVNRAKGANGSYILALGCSDPPTNTTFALRIGGSVTISAEL